jgi:hypothetical protein
MDLKSVVQKAKELPGIKKVVLMGHSGGGTLMSAYQAIAENGPKVFQGPERIFPAPDNLNDLPPADGIMLLDTNFGNAPMTVFSIDPAVIDETSGMAIDQDLNLWNPAFGFNEAGSSFDPEFIKRFQKAQGERNNRIIKNALERLALIKSGKGKFVDDEPLIIPGANQVFFNNKLYAQDTSLMSHTKKAWPLLKSDGSAPVGIVYSVRTPANRRSLTGQYRDGALVTTVQNFLSSYAVRTLSNYGYNEEEVFGIDYSSSWCCPPGNVREISAPLLAAGMTGSWEYLASEAIYENAKSQDKTLVFVEGASHGFTTAIHTERFPGEFGDTMKTLYDYVDKWLSAKGRFL